MYRILKAVLPIALLMAAASYGQSLADVARQNRANKDKSTATTKKVYTTDDLSPSEYADSGGPEKTPEQWSRQILFQKGWVAYLKAQADRLTAAAPSGFNDPQVEKARQQLAIEQGKLAQMQDAAQRAGMPSSVYNPVRPVRYMRTNGAQRYLNSLRSSH